MEPMSVISFPRGFSTHLGVWSYPAKGKGGEGALKTHAWITSLQTQSHGCINDPQLPE